MMYLSILWQNCSDSTDVPGQFLLQHTKFSLCGSLVSECVHWHCIYNQYIHYWTPGGWGMSIFFLTLLVFYRISLGNECRGMSAWLHVLASLSVHMKPAVVVNIEYQTVFMLNCFFDKSLDFNIKLATLIFKNIYVFCRMKSLQISTAFWQKCSYCYHITVLVEVWLIWPEINWCLMLTLHMVC